MEYGKTLIDKAGQMCGSFYKLSQTTGWSEGNISKVRAGKRPMPPEWAPVLAELTGEDPREALARVVAEQAPEGSRVRAILGGSRAAGAAAMLLFFVCLGWLAPSTGYAGEAMRVNTLYIVEGRGVLFRCCAALLRLFRAATLSLGLSSVFQSARLTPRPAHFCTREEWPGMPARCSGHA